MKEIKYTLTSRGAFLTEIDTKNSDTVLFKIDGEEKASYTLRGTFPGEKEATINLLATYCGCKPEDVKVEIVKI